MVPVPTAALTGEGAEASNAPPVVSANCTFTDRAPGVKLPSAVYQRCPATPALAPSLAERLRAGGRLVASGILDVRRDEVAAALAAAGLTIEETLQESDWIALICARPA